MPRNMSFAMTTEQFIEKTKTVTRRFGWYFLQKGDVINGVQKELGLQSMFKGTLRFEDCRC